ncbi:MAG: purine-nucleoside phosphorylase, partial [Verrucomicrobiota bacterium]
MNYDLLEEAFQYVQSIFPKAKPTCGLILGSGWSEAVDTFDIEKTCYYEDVPGLGKTGVIGHAGRLAWGRIEGVETLIFQGRRHFYEGEGWTPIALPVYVLKKLGVETLVLTNAAGSCRIDLHPGHLMVLEDHINNFPDHPLIGPHNEVWGARFPDQSKVYDR